MSPSNSPTSVSKHQKAELASKSLTKRLQQVLRGQESYGVRSTGNSTIRERLENHEARSRKPLITARLQQTWQNPSWDYERAIQDRLGGLLLRRQMSTTTTAGSGGDVNHQIDAAQQPSTNISESNANGRVLSAIDTSAASISSRSSAGQSVTHNGTTYTTVKEGLAYILVPPNAKTLNNPKEVPKKKRARGEKNEEHQTNQSVFYNEIMQYNRDLSVLAIRAFGEDRVERLKMQEERKERRIQEGKERGEANRRKREEQAKKAADATPIPGPTDEAFATFNGDNQASADVTRVNGLKRGHEKDGSGANDSQPNPKRSKTALDDMPINGARISSSRPDADDDTTLANTQAETSALEQTELLDEDLVNAERAANGTDRPPNRHKKPRKLHFKVLDALSATGLRALRYAHELPFVTSVVANDLSAKATEMIAVNVEHNSLQDKITPATGNAVAHMYQYVGQEHKGGPGKQYDVIDLDPYGTAVPFLDSAVQALADGGLLCVTCTDTAVFMSNGYPEKAFSLYGGTTVKGQCAHEGGLRLMLHSIATTAAKYGIAIEPLLSLSIDYYARVFVTIRKSPSDVKHLMQKTMVLNHCDNGCFAITPQWLGKSTASEDRKGQTLWKHGYAQYTGTNQCEYCGQKTHINGPMWGGPLHNPNFIDCMLGYLPEIDRSTYPTCQRIEGMLTTALEELQTFHWNEVKAPMPTKQPAPAKQEEPATPTSPTLIEPVPSEVRDLNPFYIFPSSLAKVVHCIAPSESQLKGALRHAGFKASRTHAARGGIKTDAPYAAIWHIMREWVRQRAPIKQGSLRENMPGWRIMYGHDSTKWPKIVEGADTKSGNAHGDDMEINGGAEPRRETAAATSNDADPPSKPTEAGSVKKGPDVYSRPSEKFEVVFDEELGKDKGKKLKRFQLNPRANWGPMARAK